MTSTESPFDTPPAAGGERFRNADHEGDLLIVRVKGVELGVETESGDADVIVADVTIVEGTDAGETFDDAWLFGRVLHGQLKRRIGRTMLGRLVKGQAQRGKSAPWQLDPASEADTARALAFMNRQTRPPAPEPEPEPARSGGTSRDPWATPPADEPPF